MQERRSILLDIFASTCFRGPSLEGLRIAASVRGFRTWLAWMGDRRRVLREDEAPIMNAAELKQLALWIGVRSTPMPSCWYRA